MVVCKIAGQMAACKAFSEKEGRKFISFINTPPGGSENYAVTYSADNVSCKRQKSTLKDFSFSFFSNVPLSLSPLGIKKSLCPKNITTSFLIFYVLIFDESVIKTNMSIE